MGETSTHTKEGQTPEAGQSVQATSTLTLQEIIGRDYPTPTPVVGHLLLPGEIVLFIARQKEGKSTLALQFAIDISRGDPFLDRFTTTRMPVLYVDYENRFYQLKKRGIDLAQGRTVENLYIKAFDRISDRNVSLSNDQEAGRLAALVQELQPGLLILDPLRYAWGRDSTDEQKATKLIDTISRLQAYSPKMAVLLVHHLKKQQDQLSVRLRDDPRSWIEKVYGSQALLAHVDTTWGLEADGDGYVFGTVPRSQEPLMLALEKGADSERFLLSEIETLFFTPAQQEAWNKLPSEFSWNQAIECVGASSTLSRTIRQARAAALLERDQASGLYRKIRNHGTVE
ncbi:hypothetical protein LCGC14_1171980 [marine sediment metagenome]|uniref:AAA+ ATPase domain-containing protein n=1 Tax=marine sediment metagenome TaxID=412755 RepID=A0A0F9PV33_9ZZZZ